MEVCRECNRTVYSGFQLIKTARKTTVVICDECMKKIYGKEVASAGDSKESLREHK